MAMIEVVYVPCGESSLHVRVAFFEGMTVGDVLDASGLLQTRPELIGCAIGIFSRLVSCDTVVHVGDRVELYRPLSADPKDIRRNRARKKRMA
jgi:uncharacterized protein